MRLSGQGRVAGLAAAAAVAVMGAGCAADHATKSTAPVNIVITSIEGRSGPAGSTSNVLNSDVLTKGSIIEDYALLTVANYPKNPTLIDADKIGIGTYDNVVLERYEVHFYRTDGLSVEGVDVPYGFSGPMAAMVEFNGTAPVEFIIVRHQAKLEPPLLNLEGIGNTVMSGGSLIITTYAEITVHGRTLAGDAVQASGRLQVNFADFADS
jgi:hypothetical protein